MSAAARQQQDHQLETPQVPEWIAASREGPFEARVEAVAAQLLKGLDVSGLELVQLFPKRAHDMLRIEAAMRRDTGWYVASLRFFREPFDAFAVLCRMVKANMVPTSSTGLEFYLRHSDWVRDRGELGKLSEQSLALSFRERLVEGSLPKPLPPARPRGKRPRRDI